MIEMFCLLYIFKFVVVVVMFVLFVGVVVV